MNSLYKIGSFLLLPLLIFSCDIKPPENIDTKALSKEIKSRKLRKIADADISQKAYEVGKELSKTVREQQENLSCVDNILLDQEWDTYVDKIEVICEQPKDQPVISSLYEAYNYNLKEGIEMTENLQEVSDTTFLYTIPMVKDGQLLMVNFVLLKKALVLRIQQEK
ncbi:hypothetical protein [Algivirga pacifica]|uniref:Lipoprotein n=1 Tax=Algivirga pacifica TaxID=1162670 RepID=A0ABP9D4G0_9BACT